MSTLFSLPKTQAFNSSGDPVAGAQLYFTATGTSTPQSVFQDADLNTAHSNPVTADAYGVFPAIWLQALEYRVRLTDAAGTTYWTIDDVGNESLSASAIGAALYAQTAEELACSNMDRTKR